MRRGVGAIPETFAGHQEGGLGLSVVTSVEDRHTIHGCAGC
jgi:hypothetical protein